MIFSSKKHKLPAFPDYIIPGFRRMCTAVPVDKVDALRMDLFNYMGQVESENADNKLVNLDLARQIAQRASFLLDNYETYNSHQRGLIVGAISYFISDGDGISDFDFASGLIDDAQVMNHVLEEVGVEDKFISIQQD